MNPTKELADLIACLDRQRTSVAEASFYANAILKHQKDGVETLDAYFMDDLKDGEDVYFELEELFVDKMLANDGVPDVVRSTLRYLKRLDSTTNELIDPSVRSLLFTCLLRTVEAKDCFKVVLARRQYDDFFDLFGGCVCDEQPATKRVKKA